MRPGRAGPLGASGVARHLRRLSIPLGECQYTNRDIGVWRDPLDPECQRVLTIMTSEDY
jgi:hypothetical protein